MKTIQLKIAGEGPGYNFTYLNVLPCTTAAELYKMYRDISGTECEFRFYLRLDHSKEPFSDLDHTPAYRWPYKDSCPTYWFTKGTVQDWILDHNGCVTLFTARCYDKNQFIPWPEHVNYI